MSPAIRTKGRRVSIGNYPKPDPVVVAAVDLGMKSESVHQLIYGRDNVFHRVAVIVRAMVEAGQGARAARLLAPIEDARQPLSSDFTVDLAREELEADQDEDKAKAEYYWNPCPETWATYRKALIRESYTNQLTIQAGDAKWGH